MPPRQENPFAEVEKCATSSYVLARRGLPSDPETLAELREAAVSALGAGRVESALQSYRELERQDDSVPVWSLRVAECYRRLGRVDGELSALMRAAHRYERRGFLNEALALWSRIQARDPADVSARLAVTRLMQRCDRGLDRLRSTLPPGSEPPRSAPGEVLRSGVVPTASVEPPTIPREPRLPAFEPQATFDRTATDTGARGTGRAWTHATTPTAPEDASEALRPVPLDRGARSGSEAPAAPMTRAPAPVPPPSSARLRRSVLVPPRLAEDAAPGAPPRRTPPMPFGAPVSPITPKPIIGVGATETRGARVPCPRPPTVAINPPREAPPTPRAAPAPRTSIARAGSSVLPAPIVAVEADAGAADEVEYLEAELCPFLDEIDAEW